MKKLVIVESPSKIKTLRKFIGSDYEIKASVGHIRDLPKKDLGIDVENNFRPTYALSDDKKKVIADLRKSVKSAEELYLATDPDREGEAISWHLLEVLKPKIPVKRLVFNEITKSAILEALENLREIDRDLVAAQETRRIMDRLFGFPVSKVLWINVKGGLSAGRVQSPAIKLVVDREKLRAKFKMNEYWSIDGTFASDGEKFPAILFSMNGKKIASGKDFDKTTGKLNTSNKLILDKVTADQNAKSLILNQWKVDSIDESPVTSNPYPPYITSTLQQDGVRKLRVSARQIMRIAQQLYEGGFITYIRTDSVHLSNEALQAARSQITELYGKEYLPTRSRIYKGKVKNAQEAHEAIRPSGSSFRMPSDLKGELPKINWRLYDLIWKRTIASQMKSAKLLQTNVKISDGENIFRGNGRIIQFPGYFKAYVRSRDDEKNLDNREKILPKLVEGQSVECMALDPKQHFTKPTARFTEASLIKEMEALGIGRPSTYASIMETIQKRGYVIKLNGSLVPTFTAYAVVQFLENHFKDLVDLQFTANLEESLDAISRAEVKQTEFLNHFYFGEGEHPGLKNLTEQKFDKSQSKLILELNDASGECVKLKIGRYGLYLQKDSENATVPPEFIPSDLTAKHITELFNKKKVEPENLGLFPDTNEPIYLKQGRFGPYLQTGKKMKSLLPGMSPEQVTHNIAINILSLPKVIGQHPETDEPIAADIGRYGPYIKCGKTNRKVQAPDNLLGLSIERAVQLLKESPKKTGPVVLKTFGTDPDSGMSIELKDGRYGAYVTNGKINATVPKGTSHAEINLEEALKLIAQKAAKGPTKRWRKKK